MSWRYNWIYVFAEKTGEENRVRLPRGWSRRVRRGVCGVEKIRQPRSVLPDPPQRAAAAFEGQDGLFFGYHLHRQSARETKARQCAGNRPRPSHYDQKGGGVDRRLSLCAKSLGSGTCLALLPSGKTHAAGTAPYRG